MENWFNYFKNTPQALSIMRGPFKGARMFLNPANSKRKLFGLYEACLNPWLTRVPPTKDFAFDVGSNAGYDFYGFAHLLSQGNQKETIVVGFEPAASKIRELTTPLAWPDYSKCHLEIIEKYVGDHDTDSMTTLDRAFTEKNTLSNKAGLIKIDVEGAEVDVLRGAGKLLDDPQHDWLIEIHGASRIPKVCQFFVDRNRAFLIKELSPLPIIGREKRSVETFWLVTIANNLSF